MKILAVDDDPIIHGILTEMLNVIGDHQVKCCSSVAEALETEDKSSFDCILLDIDMPGQNGIQGCKIFRDTEGFKHLPILMVTVRAEKEIVNAAFRAGATDYLTKPIELTDLRGRINLMQQLISQRAEKAEIELAEGSPGSIQFHEPFELYDIEGAVQPTALENYLLQLGRKAQFGSTIYGIAVREARKLYDSLTGYEFKGVIEDVGECLASSHQGSSFIMSYVGSGVYIIVVGGGAQPNPELMADHVETRLRNLELYRNDGTRLNIGVTNGVACRLSWRSGDRVLGALSEAQQTAELAGQLPGYPLPVGGSHILEAV